MTIFVKIMYNMLPNTFKLLKIKKIFVFSLDFTSDLC